MCIMISVQRYSNRDCAARAQKRFVTVLDEVIAEAKGKPARRAPQSAKDCGF